MMPLQKQLLSLADEKNRLFVQKLIPTLAPKTILGTKIPVLRAFAKKVSSEESQVFLATLPHYYLEENVLHGFLIEQLKDFEQVMKLTEAYLPYIDNRMTCDSFHPKICKKYPDLTYKKIKIWLKNSHPYTVRYAIGLLLADYLDKEFKPEMLDLVASVQSEEYYVQMMQARYFATALAKQYESALPLIKSQILPTFVQNKTIQKARESRRITPEIKIDLLHYKL